MIIQKSPHHILNSNKVENINVIETDVKDTGIIESNSDEFSFWSWFKGLVNPLQNLPLISGIYSSVNSENDESDRDLVQNSLGGFLYGGPIGAIVGFGNWAFNKIFNKTPTEMALDASGISNIWKDDEAEPNKRIVRNDKPIIDNNIKLQIQYSSSQSVISKKDLGANLTKFDEKKLAALTETKIKDDKVSPVTEQFKIALKSKEKVPSELALPPKANSHPIKKQNSSAIINKETNPKFREINFSYPAWKPNNKFNSIKNMEVIKKEYDKLGEVEQAKNELKFDA